MRLYVVVKSALSTGAKLAQGIHAGLQFALEHPETFQAWGNETIVVLQSDDIGSVSERLSAAGFRAVEWREPDMGDELTALCAEGEARRALSSLPLAV